jgi:hypothetical protein
MPPRNEVHVCDLPSGHRNSVDCWCEPVKIYWIRNKHNVDVFVVEHNDEVNKHHAVAVAERDFDINAGVSTPVRDPSAPWISRALNDADPPGPTLHDRSL